MFSMNWHLWKKRISLFQTLWRYARNASASRWASATAAAAMKRHVPRAKEDNRSIGVMDAPLWCKFHEVLVIRSDTNERKQGFSIPYNTSKALARSNNFENFLVRVVTGMGSKTESRGWGYPTEIIQWNSRARHPWRLNFFFFYFWCILMLR